MRYATLSLIVGLAVFGAASAAARPALSVGAGPTFYGDSYYASDVGAGATGTFTVGGSLALLIVASYDQLSFGYHPLSTLVGLRIQRAEGSSFLFDCGVGFWVARTRQDGGLALTVGIGYRFIPSSGPGWFADVHDLELGSFEGQSGTLLQIRAGISTR